MRFNLFSENYIDWKEYQNKIVMIDWLRFMTNLAIENHNNIIARIKRGDKHEF